MKCLEKVNVILARSLAPSSEFFGLPERFDAFLGLHPPNPILPAFQNDLGQRVRLTVG
jgi:hypothetical protein